MDEFYKIAEEKGWVVKKAISHSEIEKVWGGLPKEIKDKLIPGWDNMTFADLISKVEHMWGSILMEYRKQQTPPKGDVSTDPEKIKVAPQEKPARRSLSPQLIAKVQALIMKKTKIPVSDPKGKFLGAPDGSWGPRSAAAWNKYIETFTTPGGPLVVDPVAEDGSELPRMDDIRYVFNRESRAKTTLGPISVEKADDITSEAKDPYADWAESMPKLSPEEIEGLQDIRPPTQEEVLRKMRQVPGQQPGDIVVQPDDWRRRYKVRGIPSDVTESEHLSAMRLLRQQGHRGPVKDRNQYMQAIKQVRESRKMRAQEPKPFVPKIPEWAKNDDGVVASIASELVSLATDLENFGEEKAAVVVDHHLKLYTEAANKLYDITGETGEQLIDQAHPGGGPTLVPAADEGGKVETIVEDQKKNIQKTLKQPTGKYAEVMTKLIATANRLDKEGDIEAAKLVDQTIKELRDSHPFVNRSTASEATGSKDTKVSMKKEAVDVQNFDQILELRTVLAKLAKTLDDLEGEVQDQSASEVHKNIGINIFEVINDKERYDEARTKYSVPGVAGPFSYEYDDAVTKMRKTVQAWSRQLTGWPTKKNHAEWILQTLGKWEKTLGIIKKYYDTFPDDNVSGNWDNSFNLKYERAKEDLKKISNIYERVHGKGLNRTRPKKPSGTTTPKPTTPKPTTPKPATSYQRRLDMIYVKELEKANNLIDKNTEQIHLALKDPAATQKWIKKTIYNLKNPTVKGKKNPYYSGKTPNDISKLRAQIAYIEKTIKTKKASLKIQADLGTTEKNKGKGVSSEIGKGNVKPTGKRYRKPPKDPAVIKLQEALIAAGKTLGTVDGHWGPKTAKAWNAFVSEGPPGLGKYMKPIPNPNRQRHSSRPVGAIPLATRIVRYIAAKRKRTGTSFIPLSDVKVPLGALSNARTFVTYMRGSLGKPLPPKDALQYLGRLSSYVDENELSIAAKSSGAVSKWRRRIGSLMREFRGYLIQEKKSPKTTKPSSDLMNPFADEAQVGAFTYPWERGSASSPSAPGKPGRKPEEGLPGYGLGRGRTKPKGGFKELTTESTPVEIYRAIASLPEAGWLRTTRKFTMKARSVIPKTERDPVRKYWDDLDARIRKIVGALSAQKNTIKSHPQLGVKGYTDMVDAIQTFIGEHKYIGQQLGYVTE
jgi:hypothetical protein